MTDPAAPGASNAFPMTDHTPALVRTRPEALESLFDRLEPEDLQLIELWLADRPATTVRAYRSALAGYLDVTGEVPIRRQTLVDVQKFASSLEGSPAYRARQLAAIASLWAFGCKIGYLRFNAMAVVRRPKPVADRGARILTVADVNRLVYGEPDLRDRALLRTMYVAAPRVAELVALDLADVQTSDRGEFLRFVGKGGKERYVRIPTSLYADLIKLRSRFAVDDRETPLFFSRRWEGGKRQRLSARRVDEIVRAAGRRAQLHAEISPHWLRHAHASHAMDHGCPLHVLQSTLGHSSMQTTSIYAHARPDDSSALYLEGRG